MSSPRYLTNQELTEELQRCHELGRMTNRFAEMMMMIAERLAKKRNFCGYSFVEDMKAQALLKCCEKWKNFNFEKSSNPFAYFTQIIYREFINSIKAESKHGVIKDELAIDAGLLPSYSRQIDEHYQ